ncbi:MAG: DUF3473 domain-containing protein [Chitinophagaceae bacterium]
MAAVLLSFDVEEFDMPLEYGHNITINEQINIGKQGLQLIAELLSKHNIETTLFTTAFFAQQVPTTIQQLAIKHEIASHTFFHSQFSEVHLLQSRLALSKIIQKPIYGLRMPRMKKISPSLVKAAGYQYDSSINPTYLPGRYNNWHLPRTFYRQDGLLRIPASVSPNLRIPLFWLSFKNFPYKLFKSLCLQTLRTDNYVCLYFHPWEFVNIHHTGIPNYTKKGCTYELLKKLDRLIADLKNTAEFMSMHRFTESLM